MHLSAIFSVRFARLFSLYGPPHLFVGGAGFDALDPPPESRQPLQLHVTGTVLQLITQHLHRRQGDTDNSTTDLRGRGTDNGHTTAHQSGHKKGG